MIKKIKTSTSIMTIISIISSIIMCFPLNAFGADDIVIEVPDEVEYGEVEYFNEEDDEIETEAEVSIEDGKAIVTGTKKTGYYTVYFFSSDDVTIGTASFFRNNDGMICDPYDEDKSGYNPVYEKYEEVEEGNLIPDISGDMTVKVIGIPESAIKAEISLFADNGDYGDMEQKLNITDDAVIFGLGYAGEYYVSFYDIDDVLLGNASFILDENGTIKIYVEEELIEKNEVPFFEYAEEYEPDDEPSTEPSTEPTTTTEETATTTTETTTTTEETTTTTAETTTTTEETTTSTAETTTTTEETTTTTAETTTTTEETITTTAETTTTTEETTTTTAETTTAIEETTTTTAETTMTTTAEITTTETTTNPIVSTTVTSNDLPQTGNNAPNKFFITISAIMFAVSGAYVMMKSGIIRIKSK